MDTEGFRIPRRFVSRDAVDDELERLDKAIRAAGSGIGSHREMVTGELGEKYGAIFEAHLQMLQDARLRRELEEMIRHRHYSPEYAVSRTLRRYAQVFQRLESAHLAERANDIFDIEKRLLRHLLGRRREGISHLTSPVLVLAHNLTPSETANLDRRFVRGFVTEVGGPGGHTAIVAEALEIPAVVGTGPFLSEVSGGDLVIIDGDKGLVILQPDEETLARYRHEVEENPHAGRPLGFAPRSALRDGRWRRRAVVRQHRISLRSPALPRPWGLRRRALPHRIPLLGQRDRTHGRDAFPGLQPGGPHHGRPPGDDPHVRPRRRQSAPPASARRRAQSLPRAPQHPAGPALPDDVPHPVAGGPAGQRLGNLQIMFPLVSTLLELRQAKMVLADVMEDLDEHGIDFNRNLAVGMMVEVPAAVMMIDRFVEEVDFLSIGTNDLIQYTLAVDRSNKDVVSLYNPADPAVLKLIAMAIEAAGRRSIPINMCGQMSGNPLYTMLLLGMGLRQFSVTPSAIPGNQKRLPPRRPPAVRGDRGPRQDHGKRPRHQEPPPGRTEQVRSRGRTIASQCN